MRRSIQILLVLGSILQSSISTAAGCNDEFTEMYLARKRCIGGISIPQAQNSARDEQKAAEESSACLKLAIMEEVAERSSNGSHLGVSAAAGLASGIGGKMLHSLLASQGEQAVQKHEKLLAAIESEQKARMEVLKRKEKLRDQSASKVSKGRYPTMESLKKAFEALKPVRHEIGRNGKQSKVAEFPTEEGHSEAAMMGRYKKQAEMLAEADLEFQKELDAEVAKAKGTDLQEYWNEAAGRPSGGSFPMDRKINEIYSDEIKEINKANRQIEEAYKQHESEKSQKTLSAADERKFQESMEPLRKNFKQWLAKSPPNIRMVYALKYEITGLPLFGSGKVGLNYYQEKSISKIGEEGREAAAEFKSRGAKYAKVGAGVGAVAALMAQSFGSTIIHADQMNACRKELKLSDADIQYLGNGTTDAKSDGAVNVPFVKSGAICSTMSLTNPEQVIEDFRAKGGVSEGVCQIMQNENARLVKMMGEPSQSVKLSCDSFSDSNVNVDLKSGAFKFTQPTYSLSTKMTPGLNWPNFQIAKISGPDGKPDKMRELDFAGKFNNEYHPSQMPADIDVVQKYRGCDYNGAINCELLRASIKSQMALNFKQSFCEHPGSSSLGNRSENGVH